MGSIHRMLLEWMRQVLGVEVAVEDRFGAATTDSVVTVSLRHLRPAPPSAATPGSLGLTLSYLVSCRAVDALGAMDILEKLLLALPQIPAFEIQFDPPPDSYWLALGEAPRPCFSLSSTYRVTRPRPARARITQPVEFNILPAVRLTGTLVTAARQPVGGAEVRVAGTTTVAVSDAHGQFVFAALPPQPREKLLLVSYKDLRLQVPATLGAPPPFIVLTAPETV